MKRKLGAILTVSIMLIATGIATPVSAANVLHVDDDGVQWPGAYETISAALIAAGEGDTIIVHEGTYSELVNIDVNYITLSGDGAVLDGTEFTDQSDGLMTIPGPIHGITIEGLEIRNFINGDHEGNGIFVQNNSYGNTIRNNTIHDVNGAGIFFAENTSSNIVTGNYIYASGNGVGANDSHSNQILNNIFEGNLISVFMCNGSSNNLVKGNEDTGSQCGINLGGVINNDIFDNVITGANEGIWIGTDDWSNSASNNTVKGNFITVTDNPITGATGVGIYLGNANCNKIMTNTVTGSSQGILLGKDHSGVSASDNTVKGNDIADLKVGISLDNGATLNIISDNNINNSVKVGISLRGVIENTVKENIVKNSGKFGIAVVEDSSGNTLKGNTIRKSGDFDLFYDGSGSDNIWQDNKYKTANF